MKDMLHPQVQMVLDLLIEKQIPSLETLAPPEARRAYLERGPNVQPVPPEVGSALSIGTNGPDLAVPLRVYRPMGHDDQKVLPVLVWFHGGGWVIGNLDTHDTLCRELANRSGCCVISVDYRLGPEHKFPAAVEDSFNSVKWIAANASQLRIDPKRMAVGGDSAGGNLAAVVSILARDERSPEIAYQILVYPVTDLHRSYPSQKTNGEGYVLTGAMLDYFYSHYLTTTGEKSDWRGSPLLAKDLRGLPPALVLTAGFDPLRDEGAAYAIALTRAGNEATYVCFERQIHGFITMGKVFNDASPAISLCTGELRRRFFNL